jgi:hypothetical protein
MPHNMHEIHPEHPLSEPQIPRSGKSAIRPSGGLLSERRLAYFLSGAPKAELASIRTKLPVRVLVAEAAESEGPAGERHHQGGAAWF